jgi:hypothetical protein
MRGHHRATVLGIADLGKVRRGELGPQDADSGS